MSRPVEIRVVPGSAEQARSALAHQLEEQADAIGRRETKAPSTGRRTVHVPLGTVLRWALLPVVPLPALALGALHMASIIGVLVVEQIEDVVANVREAAATVRACWRE